MDKSGLLQIGDLARMFHLSVSSLRHYERLGLVRPETVDPDTGYRYYSMRQFEVLNTIRYLRILDMPLPEIADFLRNRDVDRIEEKLRIQKEAVVRKRGQLATIERKIDNRLRQLQEAAQAELDTIVLETAPACRLLWIEGALTIHDHSDMEQPVRRLVERQQEALVFLGKVGVGISAERLRAGQFTEYEGAFLVLDEEDCADGTVARLPETRCAAVRFRGSHLEAPAQYRRLMDYLAANGLEAAGFSREITMIDEGFTSDPEKFLTEIRIPVAETS